MNKRILLFLAIILPLFVLVAIGLHYSAFKGPMYYDSVAYLELKTHVFASHDILKVIRIIPQRPVSMISYYANYILWGMSPFHFRCVNAVILAITAFVAALAFILILEITDPQGHRNLREKQAVGLFLGLVFLVHPVQTYVVDYIWQRTALLSSFFYIAALTTYLATRSGKIRSAIWGYALCLVLACLALGSKENVVTLPAILILAEVAFFGQEWRGLLKRAGIFAAILLFLIGIMSFLEHPHGAAGEAPGILPMIARYYHESNLTVFQLAISQCRVLFSYLALIVVPTPSNVRFTTAHTIFSSPFESAEILAAVFGTLAIVCAGTYLIRKRPLTGFGLLFFVLNLMPDSFLIPQYLFFAFRASLPLFGLLLVFADFLLEVLSRFRLLSRRKLYTGFVSAGLLAAILLMASVTISKANLWPDSVRFWQDVVDGLPRYDEKVEKIITAQALTDLGKAEQRKGENAKAAKILEKAVEIGPRYPNAYVHLALAYVELGDVARAESYLKKAVEIDSRSVGTQFALAEFYVTQARLSEAWVQMQKAADLAPDEPRCRNGLGRILLQLEKPSEAASYFRQTIQVAPGFDEAYYNLGEAYVSMGMDQEAARYFDKALQLRRANWQAHNSLGLVLARSGKVNEAEMHFREALALSPRNWRIHNNLGALLAKDRRFAEAEEHFEQAVKDNPEDVSARKNLDRVRTLKISPSAK